jgi:hypothetical protein
LCRVSNFTPAQVALVNFDQGDDIEPFSFQLRSGQVVGAGNFYHKRTHPLSEAESANLKRMNKLKKTRLVSSGGPAHGTVPERVGGKPPPISSFARRREFGLRALAR